MGTYVELRLTARTGKLNEKDLTEEEFRVLNKEMDKIGIYLTIKGFENFNVNIYPKLGDSESNCECNGQFKWLPEINDFCMKIINTLFVRWGYIATILEYPLEVEPDNSYFLDQQDEEELHYLGATSEANLIQDKQIDDVDLVIETGESGD